MRRVQGRFRWQWSLSLVSLAILIGLVLVAVVALPQWLVDTSGLHGSDIVKAQNNFRSTMATVLAGLAVAVGAIVAALNYREASRQNRLILELQRRDQVTERFNTAVEHVGSDAIDVRIGAIYALEQIAQDSPQLHWPIVEILSAYVRGRAPLNQSSGGTRVADGGGESQRHCVPADVQAAATVIGRRRHTYDPPDRYLDLSGTDLGAAELSNAYLARADLHGANLNGSELEAADLTGAQLDNAQFMQASLRGTNLSLASAREAVFMGANLSYAILKGTDLARADLSGALLNGADLSGANLRGADCHESAIVGANLSATNFTGANLTGAVLNFAVLTEATFNDAILVLTDLTDSNVASAQGLTQDQLESAITTKPAMAVRPDGDA